MIGFPINFVNDVLTPADFSKRKIFWTCKVCCGEKSENTLKFYLKIEPFKRNTLEFYLKIEPFKRKKMSHVPPI